MASRRCSRMPLGRKAEAKGEGRSKVVEGAKVGRGRRGYNPLEGVGESAQNKKTNLEKWIEMYGRKMNSVVRETSIYLATSKRKAKKKSFQHRTQPAHPGC